MTVNARHVQTESSSLRVSAYERVAGFLIAGLVLGLVVVATLLIVWLASRSWRPVAPISVSILPEEFPGDVAGTGPRRERVDFEEPSSAETSPAENADSSLEALVATLD